MQTAEPVALPPAPVAPAGKIGGEPILADPVVLGGISVDAVRAGLDAQKAAITACHGADAGKGKVLVRFAIAADGTVASARVQSTSLRDETTETCLLGVVQGATFPPLERGDKALVTWPFLFPPTS